VSLPFAGPGGGAGLVGAGGSSPPSFHGGLTADDLVPGLFIQSSSGGFGGGGGYSDYSDYSDGGGGGEGGGGSFIASGFSNSFALSGIQSGNGLMTTTAVPEPATWIEMLSGIGFLGYLLRRRMLHGATPGAVGSPRRLRGSAEKRTLKPSAQS